MNASELARRLARIRCDQGDEYRRRGKAFVRNATRAVVKRARAALIIPHGRQVGHRVPSGGVVCEKERYRTQQAADAELNRIQVHAANQYKPERAYRCPWCGGWHLTSKR
jgi:hypothetical protein